MAAELSLVAGGQARAAEKRSKSTGLGDPFRLPAPSQPTLSEVFANQARDGGWAGFLQPQLEAGKPLLWVQDRMAIREAGRIHPAGLAGFEIIHVEARDARDALWAVEEGLRCSGLSAVIGEVWGDPPSLDFTATRRLAVAAERRQVPCWLVRLGGAANLSGARMRWRIASLPSLPNPLDPKASGAPAWDAELFRARGAVKKDHLGNGSFSPAAPGSWSVVHEANRFHLLAASGDRAVAQGNQRAA